MIPRTRGLPYASAAVAAVPAKASNGFRTFARRLRELPLTPILITIVVTALAVVAWDAYVFSNPGVPQTTRFKIESPMGTWISDGRPNTRLNGTVVFRELHSGDEIQIDNGGVVISPYRGGYRPR